MDEYILMHKVRISGSCQSLQATKRLRKQKTTTIFIYKYISIVTPTQSSGLTLPIRQYELVTKQAEDPLEETRELGAHSTVGFPIQRNVSHSPINAHLHYKITIM